MLPRVNLYNAVSVDGRVNGFNPDLGQFYALASHWLADATLVGSETMLAAEKMTDVPPEEESAFTPPQYAADDTRPLLVIVDSRGRVRTWHLWRQQPYWRVGVALCSRSTPREYLDYLRERHVDYIITGEDQVDLPAALSELAARFGVREIRVDSGGTLNGALLRAGVVSEVSVLIHPCLVGGITPASIFRTPDAASPDEALALKLQHVERMENDAVWLRYDVVRAAES